MNGFSHTNGRVNISEPPVENDGAAERASDLTWLQDRAWLWKDWWHEPEYTMETKSTRNETCCHDNRDSLFSTSSGFDNFRGLLNLCIVLLVLSNTRVALENILKYGILVDPVGYVLYVLETPYNAASVGLVLLSNMFIQIAYFTEMLLSKELPESAGRMVHCVNLVSCLVVPAGVVYNRQGSAVVAMLTLGLYSITFLKLVSYVTVNRWCRESLRATISPNGKRRRLVTESSPNKYSSTLKRQASVIHSSKSHPQSEVITDLKKKLTNYPENLTQQDMYYFMLVPTLCYELNFPKSARIRKRFLLKRLLEMVFLSQLMIGLAHQWLLPSVNNSMVPFHNMELTKIVERLLKLAVPNHLIWLLFFYWFFHSCLNVLAEVLKFGDREFYKDWWNAETVTQFWSSWNIPVHRWAVRHLYKPLLKAGFAKFTCQLAVFSVSAFFHEYLVSVPLRMFRLWAFTGMVGQIPFAFLVSKCLHGKYGNMAVWISLIIGQPLAIFMYAHDYYVLNNIGLDPMTGRS